MSAQNTWGTWFDLVTGILLFRVLLGSGSAWDGLGLELIMGDSNTILRRLDVLDCSIVGFDEELV